MNLKNKTVIELEDMMKQESLELRELLRKADKKRDFITQIHSEIQSREIWNVDVVAEKLLKQIDEYKNDISTISFNIFKHNIEDLVRKVPYYRNRYYKTGKLITNIYFDIEPIITHKLTKMKFIRTRNLGYNKKFIIKFEFNREQHKIIRSHVTNIFTTRKERPFDFIVPNKDLVKINKLILSNVKRKYLNYEDIIPDMVKLAQYIDNDLESILLAYMLSSETN